MYQYSEFDRSFVNQQSPTIAIKPSVISMANYPMMSFCSYVCAMVSISSGWLLCCEWLCLTEPLEQTAGLWRRSHGITTAAMATSALAKYAVQLAGFEDVPDILQALADVDMHAIQTSGSCIRNVTTDQFAGAAADETIDPRPFCELLRQWSTSHPEFEWLPRKFKIAVTGAAQDRAAIGVHDIGMRIHGDDDRPEDALIDIYAGGGLGRTPVLGALIREKLPAKDLLTYTEALMRVYNRYGRRDNNKSAHKDSGSAMTPEAKAVDAEWEHIKDNPSTVPAAELHRLRDFPSTCLCSANRCQHTACRSATNHRYFDRWIQHNVTLIGPTAMPS